MTPIDTEKPRPIDANKVRQGRWGWQVLMVLVGGLILAMAAWAAVEFYGEAIDPPAPVSEQAPN